MMGSPSNVALFSLPTQTGRRRRGSYGDHLDEDADGDDLARVSSPDYDERRRRKEVGIPKPATFSLFSLAYLPIEGEARNRRLSTIAFGCSSSLSQ